MFASPQKHREGRAGSLAAPAGGAGVSGQARPRVDQCRVSSVKWVSSS